VGEVVAVVERRIVVVVDVLGKYVLTFLRHDLEEHLAAEADVAKLLSYASSGCSSVYIQCEPKTRYGFGGG
jgi:hypothetical protein